MYTFVAVRFRDQWYTTRVDDEIDYEDGQQIRWGVAPVTDWAEIVTATYGPIELATRWESLGMGEGKHTHPVSQHSSR